MRLSGASALGTQLVPALLAEYGQEAGLGMLREDFPPDPAERLYLIQGPETARSLRAEVRVHTTARALADLAAGRTELALAVRRVNDGELRAAQAAGTGNLRQPGLEQVVAMSGVVIIVQRDNPVVQLGLDQVRDLLMGTITRWSVLGGPPVPVHVYALREEADATGIVRERLLGPAGRLAAGATRFEFHEDLADALAADPGGIGFVDIAHSRNARALRLRAVCGLTYAATSFHLQSEEYPLAQRMYLYASARTPPLARDFLAFAVSDRAQPVIATAGFVNLAPVLATAAETATQVAVAGEALPAELRPIAAPEVVRFRQLVAGARRLSVTFRFDVGQTTLDPRAEADIGRLARWERDPANGRKSILLIGHASLDGAYTTNLALARARAHSVAARVAALGVPVAQVDSVGPVSPIACTGGIGETDINRRVEVWIR